MSDLPPPRLRSADREQLIPPRIEHVDEIAQPRDALPKNGLHLVLTQCADIDSRADRPSKPCLLLSCYQAVGGLRLAGPALSFAKPPSDKNQNKLTRAG